MYELNKKVKEILDSEITEARTELQDLNEAEEFDFSAVQVVVWGIGDGWSYQTSNTFDAGHQSSKLSVNGESGAYDAVEEFIISNEELYNEIKNHDDFTEVVYAVAEYIAKALEVQKVYDDYLSEKGTFERAHNSMDANSVEFIVNE